MLLAPEEVEVKEEEGSEREEELAGMGKATYQINNSLLLKQESLKLQ
jgi:hypothetical protein